MDKEKPPVLNEWDALKRVTDGAIPYKDKTEVPAKKLLEAQRDADVEWYQSHSQDATQLFESLRKEGREQARQETAREIFGELEEGFLLLSTVHPQILEHIIAVLRITKSKFLEEK